MKSFSTGRGIATASLGLLIAAVIPGATGGNPIAPTAAAIMAEAFANRYEVDWISEIELVMRNRSGQERRRRFRAASKVIDDRVHSIGRLVWPEYLRGMAILTIENVDRGHDAFVYLPSLGKVRRVTTAQRGDSFFGTDVTYEDLERRRVEEFDLGDVVEEEFDGEAVYRIHGRSLRDFSYSDVAFVVARSDRAILETRYFKKGVDHPFRVWSAPRDSMIEQDGHVLPTRFAVHDRIRGTWTEVLLNRLIVNPALDDRLFSVNTLEGGRDLPLPEASEYLPGEAR